MRLQFPEVPTGDRLTLVGFPVAVLVHVDIELLRGFDLVQPLPTAPDDQAFAMGGGHGSSHVSSSSFFGFLSHRARHFVYSSDLGT